MAETGTMSSTVNDMLNGGSGNDRLKGGEGGETMSGGADTFVWMYVTESDVTNWNTDLVKDFNCAEGDLMDLSAIDANTCPYGGNWSVYPAVGNQVIDFIGDASHPFTAPGQISFAHAWGTETHILLNTDCDAEADGLIKVSGMQAVDAGCVAVLLPGARLLQHLVGLADAGRGAVEDLEPAGAALFPPGRFE
jgi:hypothetical protein